MIENEVQNENLEQPNLEEDSKELNFESENDLVDSVRNLAEQMKNVVQGENELTQDDSVDIEQEDESNSFNNDDVTPDEEVSHTEQVDKFKLPFKVVLKGRKTEYEVNNMKELVTFANAGADYTQKRQEEAPLRKIGEYVNQQNLTMDELQLLADAKRGDKTAISNMVNRYGVDIYDLDTNAEYKPSVQSTFIEHNEVDDIAREISEDKQLLENMQNSLKIVPSNIANEIVARADLLDGFRQDVANGIAQQVLPEVTKRMNIDSITRNNIGKSFYQYYGEVAQEIGNQPEVQQVAKQTQQVVNPIDKAKAGISSTKISNSTSSDIDVWDKNLSPEQLIEQIKLQAQRMRG